MTLEQTRAQMIASIWQAIAQSKIDLSSISPDDQEKLVRKIADTVMVSIDQVLDEIEQSSTPQATRALDVSENGEKVLWQGRPFLSLVEHYILTNERLKVIHGFIGRDVENFELIRIQDIDFKQNVGERMLGIGDIEIRGADLSNEAILIRNVQSPEEVYETLRRAWLEARKRYGLQFREQM